MKRVIGAAILTALAGAASAQCPTTFADASHGVFVQFDDYVVRYDRRPDGVVEELEFDTENETGYRYLSQHGILVLESWEMQFGAANLSTYEVISYDQPLPTQITAGMVYSTGTLVQYGSEAPYREPLTITVGPQSTQQIGACAMQVMQVEMRTGPAGDEYISSFTFFPALGFGVFIGGGPLGGQQDMYPPTYIGTQPPMLAAAPPLNTPPPPTPPSAPPASSTGK
ncbi:MAG: hypothetical protein AAGA70_05920 [Pseudomonadota bacterium]